MSIRYSNKTSSGAAKAGAGELYAVNLTGGSDAATLIVYDNTAGSGTVICKLACAAGVTACITLPKPAEFTTGCYLTLTGTAPSATAFYL